MRKQKGELITKKIENIKFNKPYKSNNFGDFIVVKEVERLILLEKERKIL